MQRKRTKPLQPLLNWGVSMRLIYESGKEVAAGDRVYAPKGAASRWGFIHTVEKPRNPSENGRVHIAFSHTEVTEGYPPSLLGMKWVDREDHQPSFGRRTVTINCSVSSKAARVQLHAPWLSPKQQDEENQMLQQFFAEFFGAAVDVRDEAGNLLRPLEAPKRSR